MARRTAPTAETAAPAHWEERSVSRVLSASGDRVLARSRKLVQAAREILADDGFEALTVRSVLDRTGLSRRAFYERFDGIDDLVLAVFEQTFREGADGMRAEMAAIGDPLERLRFVIEAMVVGARAEASVRYAVVLSRGHLRLAESRPDDLQRALEPFTSLIAEQLSAGMERGLVRRADPIQLATLIHDLVSATIHASLLSRGSGVRAEQSAAVVWEFCLRAVRANAPV